MPTFPGVYLDYYNVKNYGAAGDGSTDDTTFITNAMSAAASAGGGAVFFPAGTYLVSAPLNVTISSLALIGSGRNTSILKSTATFGTNGTERGILQFMSGPTQFVGNEIRDLGFDMSASNETNANSMAAIVQDNVPLAHFAVRRVQFLNTHYTDGLYCNGLGQGVGSYDILVEGVYGHNGGFDIGLFANGKQANGLVHSIVVRDIHALIDGAVNDDRIIISSNNGGSGGSEVRDVVVERVFVHVVSGASGSVNGVKLDCGTNGYMHRIAVRDIDFFSIAGITSNSPVYLQGSSGLQIEDIEIDGVRGDTCGRVNCLIQNAGGMPAPYLTLRGISLRNCQDTRGIEIYSAYLNNQGEQISLENIDLHFSTAVSGNTPVGILLTSGASNQGSGGVVRISDVTINSASTGITNNLSEAGSTQASAWTNIYLRNVRMDSVTTPWNFASGTVLKISDCPGYNPVGNVSAPGFPATTVAATNTTGVDVTAFVANGTSAITQVQIAGVGGSYVNTNFQIAANGWGAIRIPANGSVKFTYAGGTPAWTWFGD